MKQALLFLFAAVLHLPALANDNKGTVPAAEAPAPASAPVAVLPSAASGALVPVSPVAPSTPALNLSAPAAAAPVANTAASYEAASAAAAAAHSTGHSTVVKKRAEKVGFFKRAWKSMKRASMNTFVLLGIIFLGVGLLIALAASGAVGLILMLAGLVFLVLGLV